MIGDLCSRADLSLSRREEMFGLMCQQFEGITREQFDADLDEKNWVVLLSRPGCDTLCGFSTLHVYRETIGDEEIGVVYSGDTVVAGAAGIGSSLSKVWIGAVNRLRDDMRLGRILWLLLTSGYRTYRFLPMYWRDFHPRYDVATPAGALDLVNSLASRRFGELFDEDAGVVRLSRPQVLRQGLRGIPPHRLSDPHVAFFAHKNPDHELGDELVCLTELSASNLTPAGKRMWVAGEKAFGRGSSEV